MNGWEDKQVGSDLQCSTPAQLVLSCSVLQHRWFPGVYFACTAVSERVKHIASEDSRKRFISMLDFLCESFIVVSCNDQMCWRMHDFFGADSQTAWYWQHPTSPEWLTWRLHDFFGADSQTAWYWQHPTSPERLTWRLWTGLTSSSTLGPPVPQPFTRSTCPVSTNWWG